MSALDKLAEARAKFLEDSAARHRIGLLLDADSFVELDAFSAVDGGPAGVVCGFGSVMGSPVAVFSQDVTANGGALGLVAAAKIRKVYDTAAKTGVPVVGIYDSHGARVAEGASALAACGELLLCANNLSGVVPQVSLVLGVCAGTSAMLAASADFVIMSEDAEFFLTSPADGKAAATAQNAAKAGVAHIVNETQEEAVESARRLIALLPLNNLAAVPVRDFAESLSPVSAAVSADAAALAEAVCDAGSAIELLGGFAKKAYTAIATMGGYPCGVVITSGEALCANCCAKIAKAVSVFDSFQIPVVTFVNTPGFKGSAESELSGAVRDMARLAHVYAEATTAKVAVITGMAYGAAYVALAGRAANADYAIAWPEAAISALPPETAVALMFADKITADNPRSRVEREYLETVASPLEAAKNGYVDDVIDPALTRPAVLAALDLLSAKRVERAPRKHANIPL
jgi:acetyl-CoA carboxylase carboxyltransferase component